MILRSFILFSFFIIFGCTSRSPEQNNIKEKENKTSTAPMYQVVITENRGRFGYQILKDGKLVIDQPTIPAIQGNQFFSTREKAQKTADYLTEKLKKGIFPPTLAVEELDSLDVLN
jgi:hypothetical protein